MRYLSWFFVVLLLLVPESVWAQARAVTAVSNIQLSKTSDTTLANVPGLAFRLESGTRYTCFGQMTSTIGAAAGGLKMAFSTTDILSVNAMRVTAQVAGGGGVTTTALNSVLNMSLTQATGVPWVGYFDVNAGGTLVVQAAQVTSDPAATVVLVGSSMTCLPVT